MIQIKRMSNRPTLPTPRRQTTWAAGYDLVTAQPVVLKPGEQQVVPTGYAWAIPEGWVGLIESRSSLAGRDRVHVCAGIIDADYRGEVKVVLENRSKETRMYTVGERIAQMVVTMAYSTEVEEVKELRPSLRGEGGFGSTGVA